MNVDFTPPPDVTLTNGMRLALLARDAEGNTLLGEVLTLGKGRATIVDGKLRLRVPTDLAGGGSFTVHLAPITTLLNGCEIATFPGGRPFVDKVEGVPPTTFSLLNEQLLKLKEQGLLLPTSEDEADVPLILPVT